MRNSPLRSLAKNTDVLTKALNNRGYLLKTLLSLGGGVSISEMLERGLKGPTGCGLKNEGVVKGKCQIYFSKKEALLQDFERAR